MEAATSDALLATLHPSGLELSAYSLEAISDAVVESVLSAAMSQGYELRRLGQN